MMSLADDIEEGVDNLAAARDSWRDRSLDVLSVAMEEGATGGIVAICRGIIQALRLERAAPIAPALPQAPQIHVAVFERSERAVVEERRIDQPLPAKAELPALESSPVIGWLKCEIHDTQFPDDQACEECLDFAARQRREAEEAAGVYDVAETPPRPLTRRNS